MAAGPWQVYANALINILGGNIDLSNSTNLRMVLITSSYTPSRDAHDTWSDVSANEVANGNGYTTHGKLLTGTVTASGSPSDTITFDCDDQSWSGSTITTKYAGIVEDADGDGDLDGTDLLIAYCDLDTGGGSVSSTAGTLAVTIHASGMIIFSQTN